MKKYTLLGVSFLSVWLIDASEVKKAALLQNKVQPEVTNLSHYFKVLKIKVDGQPLSRIARYLQDPDGQIKNPYRGLGRKHIMLSMYKERLNAAKQFKEFVDNERKNKRNLDLASLGYAFEKAHPLHAKILLEDDGRFTGAVVQIILSDLQRNKNK